MIYLASNDFKLDKCQEILQNLGFKRLDLMQASGDASGDASGNASGGCVNTSAKIVAARNSDEASGDALLASLQARITITAVTPEALALKPQTKLKLLPLRQLKPCVDAASVAAAAQDRVCIFTSVFCASTFAQANMRTIAVGEATAKALAHTKLLATAKGQNAASMIKLIKSEFADYDFVYLRAQVASCDVAAELSALGINCSDLVCYKSVYEPSKTIEFISQQAIKAQMDLCLLSSPSLAQDLYKRLIAKDYVFINCGFCAQKKRLKIRRFRPHKVPALAVCIGASTQRCANNLYKRCCISDESSLTSLIAKALVVK